MGNFNIIFIVIDFQKKKNLEFSIQFRPVAIGFVSVVDTFLTKVDAPLFEEV